MTTNEGPYRVEDRGVEFCDWHIVNGSVSEMSYMEHKYAAIDDCARLNAAYLAGRAESAAEIERMRGIIQRWNTAIGESRAYPEECKELLKDSRSALAGGGAG